MSSIYGRRLLFVYTRYRPCRLCSYETKSSKSWLLLGWHAMQTPCLKSYRPSVHAASPLITCLDPTWKVQYTQYRDLIKYSSLSSASSPHAPSSYASPRIDSCIDCAVSSSLLLHLILCVSHNLCLFKFLIPCSSLSPHLSLLILPHSLRFIFKERHECSLALQGLLR